MIRKGNTHLISQFIEPTGHCNVFMGRVREPCWVIMSQNKSGSVIEEHTAEYIPRVKKAMIDGSAEDLLFGDELHLCIKAYDPDFFD